MHVYRLLMVGVLAIVLGLSSAPNALAVNVLNQNAFLAGITLTPNCGLPGTVVSFSGSGFGPSEHDPCHVTSHPDGLISQGTCHVTNRAFDSVVSGSFVVAAGASGSYLVAVQTTGAGYVAFAGFDTACTFELCVIQLGVEEPNGTVTWFPGYVYVDVPISQCENKTDYYADALGRTIVIHQFNQTRIKPVVGPVILIT